MNLGSATTGPVSIDLDRLIGSHAAIIANSGGGKSGLVRRLLEQTHGSIQHIILDVEDEFYTLRERYDYVIAGGDDGDIPVSVEGAKALAIGALQHGFSLIVQLNDLGASAGDFVAAFLNAMIHAPRDLWHPALVVIDEAQRFAPSGGAETPASKAVKALTGQGRKRGFTAVLASQRIAKIDANVRGDINNWMLGRVGQSLDRNAMADQLGFSAREGRERLSGMVDRHFWGFGPAISAEPVLFRVADVETTPVRPGQAKVLTPPPAGALADILAGITVEAPKDEAQGDFPAAHISGEYLKSDPEFVAMRKDRDAFERRAHAAEAARDSIRDELYAALEWQKQVREFVGRNEMSALAPATDAIPMREPAPAREEPAAPKPIARAKPVTRDADGMGGLARRFLAEIEARHPVRLSWEQWAALVQRKAKGAQFNNAKAELRTSGRIDENDSGLMSIIGSGAAPRTRADVIDAWRSVLPNMARKIFDAAIEGGDGSYEEVAARIDRQPVGAQWNAAISQLRTNGLIADAPGRVVLIDLLPGEQGGRG